MIADPSSKYRAFPPVALADRQWPNRTLDRAPLWCSVDLRDGNQALAVPMNVSQKLELFDALVRCGFKEIEVGFPAASNTEFAFMRRLIEDNRIPADVTVQVLVQAREDLIERTFESLRGVRQAIVHLYNSTSPAQRRIVFGLEKPDILALAQRGTQWIKDRAHTLKGSHIRLEYSPESFSATEVEFSLEVCEAVSAIWQPTVQEKIILNLPDTVEVAMPNVYADQIEWFCRHLSLRERALVSVHTHNDRGTGTAATELALLAGADRVEGTLFGNGERTGNLDLITVALNLYMHGIHPNLDISDINALRAVYERCTGMTVPPRHPYGGELVFTAFSGSHQDAIRKGLAAWNQPHGKGIWDIPYLTIDPSDIGREYREVIRVNSQSGKGGVAYLLESEFGIELPKDLQREFGPLANDLVDSLGREVSATELKTMFWKEYVERTSPLEIEHFHADGSAGLYRCRASLLKDGQRVAVLGEGNGPIAAFVNGLKSAGLPAFEIADYRQAALGSGTEASAISYVRILSVDRQAAWGAGVHTNIEISSIRAVVSALNRLLS
jgi:2-isopropylmalate synthase